MLGAQSFPTFQVFFCQIVGMFYHHWLEIPDTYKNYRRNASPISNVSFNVRRSLWLISHLDKGDKMLELQLA